MLNLNNSIESYDSKLRCPVLLFGIPVHSLFPAILKVSVGVLRPFLSVWPSSGAALRVNGYFVLSKIFSFGMMLLRKLYSKIHGSFITFPTVINCCTILLYAISNTHHLNISLMYLWINISFLSSHHYCKIIIESTWLHTSFDIARSIPRPRVWNVVNLSTFWLKLLFPHKNASKKLPCFLFDKKKCGIKIHEEF